VNAELFSITASTPADGRRHGAAAASGRASASAALERGLDLSARVEIGANVDASIRDQVSGTFTGGVAGKAGIALQAKFPLDLFREAGIIARVQAQAEAGAYLRAALGLELQVFRDLVRGQFEGPLRELCDIFLEEAVVEAGLWARAAFAAEIVAEAERHVATLSGPDRDAAAEALTILRILLRSLVVALSSSVSCLPGSHPSSRRTPLRGRWCGALWVRRRSCCSAMSSISG